MNILYDHQIFTWQKYGGISRYFYELITRLSGYHDANVSLFMGFHLNRYGLGNEQGRLAHFWGVTRPAIPKTTRAFKWINNALFRTAARRYSADLYHQTYYERLAPDFRGARVVTVFDMIHELYPDSFSSRERSMMARIKIQSVLEADAVICISESTKKDLQHLFGIDDDKIRVIYLGNSLDITNRKAAIMDAPYILYVGLRDGYKNFRTILSAFARSEKISKEFKLACFGGGAFTSEEIKLINSLHVSDRIVHVDGPDQKLANLYQYASAFIYPSLYEGFGIPLLEAMHYGCPVLAANTSSIPEVLGSAGLYFQPLDIDDVADKFDKILYDNGLRAQLMERGMQQSRKFGWDRCAEETMNYYKDIVGSS
jgi:glycosyltransferase involved in cell wall biosynthesis